MARLFDKEEMTLKFSVLIGLALFSFISWYMFLCFIDWFITKFIPYFKDFF